MSQNASRISELKHLIRQWTVTACCRREFILVSRLRDWLKEDKRLEDLANEVWSEGNRPVSRDQWDKIRREDAGSLRLVFALLIRRNLGRLMHAFCRLQSGPGLGFNLGTFELKYLTIEPNETEWLKELQKHWSADRRLFSPVEFESHEEIDVTEGAVIPFLTKNLLDKTQSITPASTVWLVEIPTELLGEKIYKFGSAHHHCGTDRDPNKETLNRTIEHKIRDLVIPCSRFAMKSFPDTKQMECEWKAERDAYWQTDLSAGQDIIACLGAFSEKGSIADARGKLDITTTTRHLLIEYGECDLFHHLMTTAPPAHAEEIVSVWRSLIGIVRGVQQIHYRSYEAGHSKKISRGFHFDIKPENIIRAYDFQTVGSLQGRRHCITFIVADLGLAKFEEHEEGDKLCPKIAKTKVPSSFGGYCFAPEIDGSTRSSTKEVDQTVDIWSLGCLLSIAATWVILGAQGVTQYDSIRRQAVREGQYPDPIQRDKKPLHAITAYFHHNARLLTVVPAWHRYLLEVIRRSDPLTAKIIDVIDKHMLQDDPQKRKSADELVILLTDELKHAEAGLNAQEQTSESSEQRIKLMESLEFINDMTPSNTKESNKYSRSTSSQSSIPQLSTYDGSPYSINSFRALQKTSAPSLAGSISSSRSRSSNLAPMGASIPTRRLTVPETTEEEGSAISPQSAETTQANLLIKKIHPYILNLDTDGLMFQLRADKALRGPFRLRRSSGFRDVSLIELIIDSGPDYQVPESRAKAHALLTKLRQEFDIKADIEKLSTHPRQLKTYKKIMATN